MNIHIEIKHSRIDRNFGKDDKGWMSHSTRH